MPTAIPISTNGFSLHSSTPNNRHERAWPFPTASTATIPAHLSTQGAPHHAKHQPPVPHGHAVHERPAIHDNADSTTMTTHCQRHTRPLTAHFPVTDGPRNTHGRARRDRRGTCHPRQLKTTVTTAGHLLPPPLGLVCLPSYFFILPACSDFLYESKLLNVFMLYLVI